MAVSKQFQIRTILALMMVIACAVRFFTLEGDWVFRTFVTVTLATFMVAVVALIYYLLLPRND